MKLHDGCTDLAVAVLLHVAEQDGKRAGDARLGPLMERCRLITCYGWPGGNDLQFEPLAANTDALRAVLALHERALEWLDTLGAFFEPGWYEDIRLTCGCPRDRREGPLSTAYAREALVELRRILQLALKDAEGSSAS